ncbi:MAG: hypothetical protein O7A98_11440, partial [Acidobacteria bacterium]|nr:hypothetical protein [Acidobacteriota bacterium]
MANRVQNGGRRWATLLVVALWACVGQASGRIERSPSPATGSGTEARPLTQASDWQAVEQLIAQRKYRAAAEAVAQLRGQAQVAGASAEWTRALVKEVQLTVALGSVETAVRLLRETPWPAGKVEQTVLTLLYGHSLARYLDVYGWEIGQRERVATADDLDLEQWTRAQIVTAIDEAYSGLWAERDAWGAEPIGELAEYLDQNDYPARIRGTLRDVVTYLWVEFLANTAYWAPEESHTVYRLDVAALAAGEASANSGQHPLVRLAAGLADLERWHRAGERPEAAFEAVLQRLSRLESNLTRDADRTLVRRYLESALTALGRHYSWWSMGQAQLARMVQSEADPDSRVRARDLAQAGRDAHPKSTGGRRCASLVAGFEAPGLNLESMSSDGLGQRSLLLRHKNLATVFFRAYALDLETTLTESQDFNLLPDQRHIEGLLARGEPSHRWRIDLPATPDLRQHQTFVTPPFE